MPTKGFNFARTPEGLVLMADGVSKPQRWDGLAAAATNAGLAAPTTAPAVGSTGSGKIFGTYYAFQRFLDKDGNVSSLSPISPALLTSFGSNITAATNATPISITSASHGLVSGAMVKIRNVQGNTAANGQWRITRVDANTFTLNNSTGNAAYTGAGCWINDARHGFIADKYKIDIGGGGDATIFSHVIADHDLFSNGTLYTYFVNLNSKAVSRRTLTGFTTPAIDLVAFLSTASPGKYTWPFNSTKDLLDGRDALWFARTFSSSADFNEQISSTLSDTTTTTQRLLTDSTNASPIVITTAVEHGMDSGCIVRVGGVTGNTAANGVWEVTRISLLTFSLNDSTGNGAHAGTASWSFGSPIYGASTTNAAKSVTDATNATPIRITTSAVHGYSANDVVNISGVGGNTAANGNWVINTISLTTFDLIGSVGNGPFSAVGTSQKYVKIKCLAHGQADGSTVYIQRLIMNTGGANHIITDVAGSYVIKLVDVNSFGLVGKISSTNVYYGGGGFTSGGAQFILGVDGNADSNELTIFAVAHGLSDGALLSISGTIGPLALDGTWYASNVDTDHFIIRKTARVVPDPAKQPKYQEPVLATASGLPRKPTAGYFGGATWQGGVGTINYTGVEIPVDSRVTRRQILRNTAGQANVFYVDVDTTDLISTSFSSTKIDNDLAAQEAVALFNPTTKVALIDFRGHDQPPDNKSVLAHHLGRMFAAVDVPYSTGNVITTKDGGLITGATNANPIEITSAAHGIATGTSVVITGVIGNTAANATVTATSTGTNTFTIGVAGNGAYTGGGEWRLASAQQTGSITAASNATPIIITSTAHGLVSRRTVTVASVGGNTAANGTWTITKLDADRFALVGSVGNAQYSSGGTWTSGVSTITGVSTNWASVFKTRFLYVVGQTKSYEIASVNATAQTTIVFPAYQGAADAFAVYSIKPAPGERKLVYWSGTGQPESWNLTDAIGVQDDGDDITGLMVKQSFLYVLEKRHIYRFTFESDPSDGQIFLASNRGCVNNRCWVVVEGLAYMLDESGIHSFAGGGDPNPVSLAIADIFRQDPARYRINWSASDYFHAVHFSSQETIRWFVALAGQQYPRHAICYHYRNQVWWVEEFAQPICSSAAAFAAEPVVYVGSHAQQVMQFWKGQLDGPDPGAGTVRGTITAATLASITDSNASFASSGVIGHPISIVSGTGKGQQRLVVSVSSGIITVNQPWLILPIANESVYQLGGVQWSYRSGVYSYLESEDSEPTRVTALFKPAAYPGTMDIRVYEDESDVAVKWQGARDDNGVTVAVGESDIVVDLYRRHDQAQTGFAAQRIDRHREVYSDGPRNVSVELAGVTNRDQTKIYDVTVEGAQAE